ncbi:MAG: hypothetical protein H7Z41_13025 [Cytophagales bacterium]|nr:hypothetical protein [Armatimonadota bacterium]
MQNRLSRRRWTNAAFFAATAHLAGSVAIRPVFAAVQNPASDAPTTNPLVPKILAPRTSDVANGDYGPYLTYQEMQVKIADWVRLYPQTIQVSSLGKTFEGRDIPLLRLSAAPGDAPEVLLLSGIHPREQQPQIGVAALVDDLLTSYRKDAALTKLLRERVIWIVPVLNVDGKVYDMQHGDGKARGADWRKNRHPNSDGKTVGVDLNRNWGVRWGGNRQVDPGWNASTQDGKGDIYEGIAPLSEPEDQALAQFIQSRRGHLHGFLDIHSPLRALFAPTYLIGPEHDRYRALLDGMRARQKQPYPTTELRRDAEPPPGARGGNSGTTYNWVYYTQGVYALNLEFAPPKEARSGIRARYAPPREIESEYMRNVRGPVLYFIEAVGGLPLPRSGSATIAAGSGTTDRPPVPGATVSWTPPAITGDWASAILVSEGAEVSVASEYRKAPLSGGFTLLIDAKAKPGTAVPMTLYVWDKERGVTTAPLNLRVAESIAPRSAAGTER